MKTSALRIIFVGAALLLWPGCVTSERQGLDSLRPHPIEKTSFSRELDLSRESEERVLALDPERVTAEEIRELLSQAPAPRIINIHGGILPIKGSMISFSEFLIGMGYPEASIRNPRDGTYTFGYYDSTPKIAGAIAWYYEREGLRPIIVGHSQGGFQVVKVLHRLAGEFAPRLPVWNPLTWKAEDRYDIIDPLTGETRPVVGLQVSYATAVASGGLARLLPNQWSMDRKLRKIPDSVEEFTGFQKGLDLLGGDYLGYGPANVYKPTGKAIVCNVRLPSTYAHSSIPDTRHLLKSQEMKDWINNYRPSGKPEDTPEPPGEFESDSSNILWAANVWHGIKKHWVIELQRLIRAKRSLSHGK